MTDPVLNAMRDLIQEDIGHRGLRADPEANLITAFPGDFAAACRSLAETPNTAVAIVTGFYIPHAQPPCGETDGPLGALFLARALVPLGIKVALATDFFCKRALEAGLEACGLDKTVVLLTLPPPTQTDLWKVFVELDWQKGFQTYFHLTHLIALERVGPSHTPASLAAQPGSTEAVVEQYVREVPAQEHDRCHTMRGLDISAHMATAHLLFEAAPRWQPAVTTIGIGDGGNEIGMGKIPWPIIRRNIPRGGLIACRVPTDYLIVCAVSNWGAYGLAAGVRYLRRASSDADLFDVNREHELLRVMVERGPLVDGVSGQQAIAVDGLSFERYAEPMPRLRELLDPAGIESSFREG
jgi:hypothetical protein